MHLTGHCNCNGVSYQFDGEPELVGFCHCKACQRQAGGSGSFFVLVDEAGLKITETTMKKFITVADSGYNVNRHFCGTCGSPILSRCDIIPGKAFLKAGTMDDSSGLTPTVEVWCEEALSWAPKLGAADRFAKAP